jgi:ATP-dependent Lon protease
MSDNRTIELAHDALHRRYTEAEIDAARALNAIAPNATIGQARALEALRLGLALDAPGFNVFVCGPAGTGKMSTVRAVLREGIKPTGPLRDIVFVRNFTDPDRPQLLTFPVGQARPFRRAIETFVRSMREIVGRALDGGEVDRARQVQLAECEGLETTELEAFEGRCRAQRFALVRVQIGEAEQLDVMPIYKREPIEIDALNEIAQNGGRVPKLAELNRANGQLKDELREILVRLRRCAFRAHDAIEDLEREAVRQAFNEPLDELAATFPDDGVPGWLSGAGDWLAEHYGQIREDDDQGFEQIKRATRVNVLLDNTGKTEPPIVFETAPTFASLLGTVEQPANEARPTLDFGDIKGGSLLRADGGVLVVNADHAVQHEGVWRSLSRVLRTQALEIQSPEQVLSPVGGSALKPQAIPLRVKVIAIGNSGLYHLLHSSTDDFPRVFKVKAEFDEALPQEPAALAIYVAHADRVTEEEGLPPLSDGGLARLAEYGVRLAGRQRWLSARFGVLTDVLREGAHTASIAKSETTDRCHIEAALAARRRRHTMAEDHLRRLAREGILDITTRGELIGVANALTVLDLGDHAFGQPCRMSATCAPGHEGLVSVERDVGLAGRIHNKATLILAGYLRTHYLPDELMALTATIAFEQLHDEVDGDSASVAEGVALVSALARIPVNQGVAMTGAMDQRGRVMPVGGVTEKVEGFFHLCVEQGLTGAQGVIIPEDNAADLVLSADVVRAVESGDFHVWTAGHLDGVIARVTNRVAGQRLEGGLFPEGSVNALVRARLRALAEASGRKPR